MAVLLSILVIRGAMRLRPNFAATTSVVMQHRNSDMADVALASGLIETDLFAIRTQTDALRSADLPRDVIRQMHLVELPEFLPTPGNPIIAKIRAFIRLPGTTEIPTAAEREVLAVQTSLGMVSVVNDGRPYVIDIKTKVTADADQTVDHAATLSAVIANTYADAYMQFTGRMKSNSIRRANSFFDERIDGLKEKMLVAEHAVQTYRDRNGLAEDSAASENGRSVTLVGQ